ncbi:endonuclease V [Aliikangiella sp. IMCC44632]
MILAVDVDYRDNRAMVAGVCFGSWFDEKPESIVKSQVSEIKEYESGSFYKRELPCILQLIKEHNLQPSLIIVDGFVVLGAESRAGLGMHLYQALNENIPVIGVAKKPFKDTNKESEVFRGKSLKPLLITAVGIKLENAKEKIQSMHGKHRLPTLLKLVDYECRKS